MAKHLANGWRLGETRDVAQPFLVGSSEHIARSVACPVQTSSSRLWGLDWNTILPWSLGAITVEAGTFAEAEPFIAKHYGTIFAGIQGERFLSDPMSGAKRRFAEEMDFLLLRSGTQTVGLLAGHPCDWSSYYMRTVAILPEFRDQKLLTKLMERTYEPLCAAGVERIEGECSPANLPMMRMLTGQGFWVTSTGNSERWGATVRFAKFLREEAEAVFARQFCGISRKPRAVEAP